MGSTASAITIHFNRKLPFVAGQQVTGTVMFNNTLQRGVKFQRIYAEFIGEVIYTTKQYTKGGSSYVTHHEPFFQQLINLDEKQEDFAHENDSCSWPVFFSLPTFLPPSLNQLYRHGPYVRYTIRVIFKRPEMYRMNIHRKFPIFVIACPSSYSQPSYFSTEAKNKNRSGVTVHAALADRNGSFSPGDHFLINIDLHNPNHNTIKCLTIGLVQHRNIGMGKHCQQTIRLFNLPHLRKFSGENYHETLELTIPDDNRTIPSYYCIPPTPSRKPIAVSYMLEVKVKTHGIFKDFILNIPIVLHPKEMYMAPPNEEEASPPSYDFAIATH